MNIDKIISDFYKFGQILNEFSSNDGYNNTLQIIDNNSIEELNQEIENAIHFNAWFTPENIRKSFAGLSHMLSEEKLKSWIEMYTTTNFNPPNPKIIGVVMAGNIPLVGFHDLLSILISGNIALVKFSSSDNRLWPHLLSILYKIDSEYKNRIKISGDKLKGFDAVIATGSNNTARYFDYYFGKYPNIIRKNRNGVAIIKGNESKDDLKNLADDIFSFFGLGCRNVSKIYIPDDYRLDNIFEQLYDYNPIINRHKYANNFDYNRTVMMLNKDDILENGFVIFKSEKDIASPLACVYYERYSDLDNLKSELKIMEERIQCIVSSDDIPFGNSQKPELWDYADGVDTIEFLGSL